MGEKVDVLAVLARMANCQYDGTMSGRYSEEEARAARAAVAELIEALRIAVRQNSHDMLMTGEELRICTAALARVGAALALARVGAA